MSTPTPLQAKLVPMALSIDGVTYKNVVCKRTANFTGTTPTNREDTDCGNFVALGANEWSFDFEGVFNTQIEATEYSAQEILNFWQSQQSLHVKVQYPTSGTPGSNLYLQGAGYLTGTGVGLSTGSLVTFTFTFTGTGDVDIAA